MAINAKKLENMNYLIKTNGQIMAINANDANILISKGKAELIKKSDIVKIEMKRDLTTGKKNLRVGINEVDYKTAKAIEFGKLGVIVDDMRTQKEILKAKIKEKEANFKDEIEEKEKIAKKPQNKIQKRTYKRK